MPDVLRLEWTESIGVLQDILGRDVRVASVPGGYYSTAVAHAAAAAGIHTLFTSEPVTRPSVAGPCTVLGRFAIRQYQRTHARRAARAHRSLDPLGDVDRLERQGALQTHSRTCLHTRRRLAHGPAHDHT